MSHRKINYPHQGIYMQNDNSEDNSDSLEEVEYLYAIYTVTPQK